MMAILEHHSLIGGRSENPLIESEMDMVEAEEARSAADKMMGNTICVSCVDAAEE